MSTYSNLEAPKDLANIVDDLIVMFLAIERIQSSLSSSTNKNGDVNDAYIFALSKLLAGNTKIDSERFTNIFCKCKELWTPTPETTNFIKEQADLLPLCMAIAFCVPDADSSLKAAIAKQTRAQWLHACSLSQNKRPDETPYYKVMVNDRGRLVRKLAIPSVAAITLVTSWIPKAVETIRQNCVTDLTLYDQAQHEIAKGDYTAIPIAQDQD